MIRTNRAAVLAAIFAGGLVAGLATSASAATCARRISADGAQTMWNKADDAKASAVANWTSKVASQLGAQWSDWARAEGKSVTCRNINRSIIVCTASANACRP